VGGQKKKQEIMFASLLTWSAQNCNKKLTTKTCFISEKDPCIHTAEILCKVSHRIKPYACLSEEGQQFLTWSTVQGVNMI
jgi:hypothetical protein